MSAALSSRFAAGYGIAAGTIIRLVEAFDARAGLVAGTRHCCRALDSISIFHHQSYEAYTSIDMYIIIAPQYCGPYLLFLYKNRIVIYILYEFYRYL